MAKATRKLKRVVVSVLLKKEARDSESIQTLQRNAIALGLQPTSQGRVSVSFQTTPKHFKELFGVEAEHVGERKATETDKGAPEGFQVETALPIPEVLKAQTQSISIEPPATRLSDQVGPIDLTHSNPWSSHDGQWQKVRQKEEGKEGDKKEGT